jgi:hypothetical protein
MTAVGIRISFPRFVRKSYLRLARSESIHASDATGAHGGVSGASDATAPVGMSRTAGPSFLRFVRRPYPSCSPARGSVSVLAPSCASASSRVKPCRFKGPSQPTAAAAYVMTRSCVASVAVNSVRRALAEPHSTLSLLTRLHQM